MCRAALPKCGLLLALLLTIAANSDARAQLFNSSRASNPNAANPFGAAQGPFGPSSESVSGGVGQVRRNQRFLRGNRRRNDFVGGDSRERRAFVGSRQGRTSGSVRSATAGLTERRSTRQSINVPRTPAPANQMYDPKLQVDFAVPAADPRAISELAVRLNRLASRGRQIEVSLAARTATLRGAVPSADDRELAEILARFEPAVSEVRNLLQVVPAENSERPQPASMVPPAPAAAEPN